MPKSADSSCAYYGPVGEDILDKHYHRTGAMYPGEKVCSRIRWRIYLRKRKNVRRFESAAYLDAGVGNRRNGTPIATGY